MSDRALTNPSAAGPSPDASSLGSILLRFRGVLIAVAAMSGVVNVLYLTGSFFMLQVYDRVIPSRSLPTLAALSALALALYGFQAILGFPAQSRPRPHRGVARFRAHLEGLRSPDAASAALQGRRRRSTAASRPRYAAQLPPRHGPYGVLRPALDPDLPVLLLPVSSGDRLGGGGRSRAARLGRARDGTADAGAGAADVGPRIAAERDGRGGTPQCGGRHRDGDGSRPRAAVGRGERPVHAPAAAELGCRQRPRVGVEVLPDGAAIGRAGARRLSRHRRPGDGRHHPSRVPS